MELIRRSQACKDHVAVVCKFWPNAIDSIAESEVGLYKSSNRATSARDNNDCDSTGVGRGEIVKFANIDQLRPWNRDYCASPKDKFCQGNLYSRQPSRFIGKGHLIKGEFGIDDSTNSEYGL